MAGIPPATTFGRRHQDGRATGSEILAKCLKKEGVEDIFYIMGGPMLLAKATCITEGIRMIDVRHEQAAAFACQAYSRLKQCRACAWRRRVQA